MIHALQSIDVLPDTGDEIVDHLIEYFSIHKLCKDDEAQGCYYRHEGRACAVGAFMPDHVYGEMFADDSGNVDDLFDEYQHSIAQGYAYSDEVSDWMKWLDRHRDLMARLQNIHDTEVKDNHEFVARLKHLRKHSSLVQGSL